MGKPEASVENKFCKMARDNGYLAFKFRALGIAGVPDRILVGHRQVIFVELKAPDETIRKLQRRMIRKMKDHGALVVVLDTKEQVELFYQAISDNEQDVRQDDQAAQMEKSLSDHEFNDWYILNRLR